MKANELRIGNYFIGYDKTLLQVDTRFFALIHAGAEVDELVKEFVPLTEEWLLKFGFTKDYKKENWIGYFPLMLKKSLQTHWSVRIICNNVKDHFSTTAEIKHVHQLQNLYFALTGEELKLFKQ